MRTFFISGHLDVTDAEFETHYKPRIQAAAEAGGAFVVGDARGTDHKAQVFLRVLNHEHVRVFHMFEEARHHEGYPTIGGFTSDDTRDAAMTAASDEDIAWVRSGREKSGTAKNLQRRKR